MLTEAGLEVEQVEHFERHPVVEDWLARVETPPARTRARVRELLADHVHDGVPDAEVDRRQGTQGAEIVAIIVDKDTRLVVQGLTGSEGRFHGLRNRNYGTKVVAGVTPGKAGQDVEGIPVFNTVADAVQETGANTTLIFVPGALRDRRDLRGRRRRHRDRDLHHRAHSGARHAARLHVHPRQGRHDDRAELPRRALAGQGERRDHPCRDLLAKARSGSSPAPGRSRTRSATSSRSSASGTRRSSGSVAIRSSARPSSTSSRGSRRIRRRS